MAKYVYYKCPDCGGTFRHMHVLLDDPPPERCELCGAWVADDEPPEAVFVPQAPRIRESPFAKSVDQTYRAMEESSIQRAKDAADMAGVPESEMSHIKITNMRDPSEMREGDIAAILPAASTAAAQRLTVGPSVPAFQQMSGGIANYAPGLGPTGASTVASVTTGHHQRAVQMIRAGNMGSYTEK
jgi:hypothetical protein